MRPILTDWLETQGLPAWLAPTYWSMLTMAIVAACLLTQWLWRRGGQDSKTASDLLFWGILGLFAGSKVFYFLQYGFRIVQEVKSVYADCQVHGIVGETNVFNVCVNDANVVQPELTVFSSGDAIHDYVTIDMYEVRCRQLSRCDFCEIPRTASYFYDCTDVISLRDPIVKFYDHLLVGRVYPTHRIVVNGVAFP